MINPDKNTQSVTYEKANFVIQKDFQNSNEMTDNKLQR